MRPQRETRAKNPWCIDSFIFLLLSMIIIAATLYLPEHVMIIARRMSFYWGGEESAAIVHEAVTTATRSWANAKTVEAEQVTEKLSDL